MGRTAGRTFYTCLLKQGTPASKLCARSYDRLRVRGDPICKLLSSHDDFSVMQRLPPGVSVISQIRDPVQRFVSTYEFAVTVGSGVEAV